MGNEGEFPPTTWGMILGLGGRKDRSAFEALCRRYWEPIFRYARAAWATRDEDARDLTQEFFLWLMEDPVLAKYERERGSFRNFLKGVLRNFEKRREEAARRQKRGGGRRAVPLDALGSGVRAPEEARDAVFEKAWKDEVLRRALERVRGASRTPLQEAQFRAFEAYDLAEGERPTYGAIAERLGVRESDVRNYLHAVRERVRAAARAELAETVATARDLDEEWERLVR